MLYRNPSGTMSRDLRHFISMGLIALHPLYYKDNAGYTQVSNI